MTTNVNFRVDVTGAPAARTQVRGLRDDMNATRDAANNATRSRVAGYNRAEDDVNRRRGLAVQQEIQAQRRQAEAGRQALQQRLAEFKRSKAEEARESERARREELARERQHGAALMAMHRRQAEMARNGGGAVPRVPARGNSADGKSSGVGSLLAGRALGLGARVLAPLAAAKGIGDSVGAFAQYEKLGVTLEVLFESGAKANKVLSELNNLSLKTGVGVERFAKAATTMNGFGVEADKIVPKLTQIAAITRGDAEKMDRLALAFAQSAGQGRLMAEELNQMIDAGFNPLLQISKDTGLSIVELRKRMRDGKLDFDLLSDAMDNLVAAGGKYENMMDQMERTTSVKIAKMTLAFTNLYRAAGKALASDESKLGAATGAVTGGTASTVNYLSEGITQMTATPKARQEAFEASWKRTAEESPTTRGMGIDAAREALKLDKQISENADKRMKAAEQEARANKKAKDDEAAAVKSMLVSQATQLRNAYQLSNIQKETAKDAIEAQKKLLEAERKRIAEMQKNLTGGVEKFASMSQEEKQASIKVLQKARSGEQLTFDEADKLEQIGSKESKTLADRNKTRLAMGAGFDALGEQAMTKKIAPIEQQLDQVKSARAQLLAKGRMDYTSVQVKDEKAEGAEPKTRVVAVANGNRIFSRSQQQQLQQYDSQINDLEIQKQVQARTVQKQVAADKDLYGNVFGSEQQAIRAEVQKSQQISANIKQTIEFKANFENSAKQIAAEVEGRFRQASAEQMKEVLTLLKPVMDKIRVDRANAVSRAAMAGSK